MERLKDLGGHLPQRLTVCAVGMFVYASGVALTKNCDIGISPITSVAYALSLLTGITMGWCTTIQNFAFFAIQRLLLKKEYGLGTAAAQLVMSILFSLFIDFTALVWGFVRPAGWPGKLAVFAAGCAVLALGMCMVMLADFVVLPAEGAVMAITRASQVKFGTVKVCFDGSMVAITILLTWVFLGRVAGIGAGTVIAVLLIGTLARPIGPFLKRALGPYMSK